MKSTIKNLKSPIAFTLVELLVVVTIIIVLLALLTPAMDTAIYQAELAVCGATQKMIAGSSTLYAMGNKRQYPSNTKRRAAYTMPDHIGTGIAFEEDLRPIVKDYIPIKSWVDTFCEPVDLSENANHPETVAVASYNYWAGWQYTGAYGGSGMIKLGDELGWRDYGPRGPGVPEHDDRASLLVSDRNDIHANSTYIESSHPDAGGVLRSFKVQNADVLYYFYTESMWFDGDRFIPRGTVDLNFGYDDGSVLRHTGVTGDVNAAPLESANGTIFHAAPWHAEGAPAAWRFLPVDR